MAINGNLVRKQGLTELEVDVVKALHIERHILFLKMEKTSNQKELRKMVQDLQDIEFSMQRAWKFPEDARYHTWWFQAPKCSCPRLDNQDRIGTGEKIISADCILHGRIEK